MPKVIKHNDMVLEVRVLLPETYDPEWNFQLALFSDAHWDNVGCLQKLWYQHLNEAKRRGAYIGLCGDVYCAMQGKYDPRSSKSDIREEHSRTNYIDSLVDTFVDRHMEYSDLLLWFGEGNHETNIKSRRETDMVQRTVDQMRYRNPATPFQKMGYHGFVVLKFYSGGGTETKDISKGGKARNRQTYILYFHHGKFSGVVSKGTQSVTRHGLWIPDADFVYTGHTHDRWQLDQPRLRINPHTNKVVTSVSEHMKGGSYKRKYAKGSAWEVEKGLGPKPYGGWFIKVFADPGRESMHHLAAVTEKMYVPYAQLDETWFNE